MTREQYIRTLRGIKAAIAAIDDESPITDSERREHDRLVAREIARYGIGQQQQTALEFD